MTYFVVLGHRRQLVRLFFQVWVDLRQNMGHSWLSTMTPLETYYTRDSSSTTSKNHKDTGENSRKKRRKIYNEADIFCLEQNFMFNFCIPVDKHTTTKA